jgi:dipeptide/tripeptide permease|tara:strand:+ start:1158 stop:2582 length:1425 start_codon:yes stop_codon:yes gene_type:complete
VGRISKTFKQFPQTFWIANSIELFERWAWYGFFMLFANYLTGSSDVGGLEFTQTQKGLIMGVGTGILYFLPVLTGSIADKYGYKRVLLIAFIIYTSAFILLPLFNTFAGVFAMYLYLAVGAALFKPIIQATVAKTTTNNTSSIGFGIFYMMVNIGAFFGPMITLLYKSNYELVFYISAGVVALNFILLLFYREPGRTKSTETLSSTINQVFKNIWLVLHDFKFVIFLLIVAGFWTMYYQLFFTLPVFVTQWVDTSNLYDFFNTYIPVVAKEYGSHGNMESEFIVNFDALFIILFQVFISALVMKKKSLNTMIAGFIIASIGMALTLVTQNVIFVLVAILIFSIGEMAASPKITEYIGRIASSDKKALYMGYSFLPVFLGSIFAGFISGNVYQSMSDKHALLVKEVSLRGFIIPDGLSSNKYFAEAASQMNLSQRELTNYLWNNYHPSNIWIVIISIGLFSALCLWLYNRFLIKA